MKRPTRKSKNPPPGFKPKQFRAPKSLITQARNSGYYHYAVLRDSHPTALPITDPVWTSNKADAIKAAQAEADSSGWSVAVYYPLIGETKAGLVKVVKPRTQNGKTPDGYKPLDHLKKATLFGRIAKAKSKGAGVQNPNSPLPVVRVLMDKYLPSPGKPTLTSRGDKEKLEMARKLAKSKGSKTIVDLVTGTGKHVVYMAVDEAPDVVRRIAGAENPSKRRARKTGKTVRNGSTSPTTLSKAARTHAAFIGKPLSQVRTRQIQIAVRTPDNLAQIAPLVKMKLQTPAGSKEVCWSGQSRPMLLSNADGTQLYLHGGSQNLDPAKLGTRAAKFLSKDLILLGLITEISYEAQKRMHNFRLTEYYHKASEDTLASRGRRGPQVFISPMLVLDKLNRRLLIVGGTYRIKSPGIID